MRMSWIRDRRNGVGEQEVGGCLDRNFSMAERPWVCGMLVYKDDDINGGKQGIQWEGNG